MKVTYFHYDPDLDAYKLSENMESNVSWVTFDTCMRTGFPDPVTLLICKTFLSWIRAFMQGVHVHEVCTNVCQGCMYHASSRTEISCTSCLCLLCK